jgi:hypothetical protein
MRTTITRDAAETLNTESLIDFPFVAQVAFGNSLRFIESARTLAPKRFRPNVSLRPTFRSVQHNARHHFYGRSVALSSARLFFQADSVARLKTDARGLSLVVARSKLARDDALAKLGPSAWAMGALSGLVVIRLNLQDPKRSSSTPDLSVRIQPAG